MCIRDRSEGEDAQVLRPDGRVRGQPDRRAQQGAPHPGGGEAARAGLFDRVGERNRRIDRPLQALIKAVVRPSGEPP